LLEVVKLRCEVSIDSNVNGIVSNNKTNENNNNNNRNTNTNKGQPALKTKQIKTILLRTKTMTTTESREPS